MDDLFRRVNKYSMLEDDVRAASQQVLVTNNLTKNDNTGSSKPSNQLRQANKRRNNLQQQQIILTLLNISYERLLSQIHDLSDFRWSEPIKMDSAKRDRNKRCSYHKDHDHTTKQCKSLHYLVEKLIRAKHLKQYVRSTSRQRKVAQEATVQAPASPVAPRAIINYIHKGSIDNKHNSKRQRQRLLCVASVRDRINSVQHTFSEGS